jgi:hypothetical protein
VNGHCGADLCGLPLLTCGAACVDPRFDPANCGTCGHTCDLGLLCTGGQCVTACADGTTACGATCVDLARDVFNCGTCGHPCQGGEFCAGGTCALFCSPGQLACNGQCVRPATDPANCGLCGHACGPTEVCSSGQCASACVLPLITCGATCVDPNNDPAHCSGCSAPCPAVNHAAPLCLNGTCGHTCLPGFADCNHLATDGCEAALATDDANCGLCGVACGGAQHCSAGTCQ